MDDEFLALLKYYAAHDIVSSVGCGGAPVLVAEVRTDGCGEAPDTFWYRQAVLYALASPLFEDGQLERDELLVATGKTVLQPPDAPLARRRRRPDGLDQLAIAMARKAIAIADRSALRYPSLGPGARDRQIENTRAAIFMFARAWPTLPRALFGAVDPPTGKNRGKPERIGKFCCLARDDAREKEALKEVASTLKTKLRDGGTPDERVLKPGDRDSTNALVTEEKIEPVVSGSRIKNLEAVFRLSDRVIIAAHLMMVGAGRRGRWTTQEAADRAALLLRGRGEATAVAKKQEGLRELDDLMAALAVRPRSAGIDLAIHVRLVAETLLKRAENEADKDAKRDPAKAEEDPRRRNTDVHAARILALLPVGSELRREPQTYRDWLMNYRGIEQRWQRLEMQRTSDDGVVDDVALQRISDAIDGQKRTPGRIDGYETPDYMRPDHRITDPLVNLLAAHLRPETYWREVVRWADEAYPFEDPDDGVPPIEQQRNQVAMLLGMPELLLPDTLPPIRLLAEGKRRDGFHTAHRWQRLSLLLNEPVGRLKKEEARLGEFFAQALQRRHRNDDPAGEEEEDEAGQPPRSPPPKDHLRKQAAMAPATPDREGTCSP